MNEARSMNEPLTHDETIQLGKLLAKMHNSLTPNFCGIYGVKMERALCRDVFNLLFIHFRTYNDLLEIQKQFEKKEND